MAGKGGGAWKVAYADFVTAMMAFFLVMWITSQNQDVKESIAQHFRDPFATGTEKGPVSMRREGTNIPSPDAENHGGSLRKPRMRVRDPGDPTRNGSTVLFEGAGAELNDAAKERLDRLAFYLQGKPNRIEIRGHSSRLPLPPDSPYANAWELSYARCLATMEYLVGRGIRQERILLSQAGIYETRSIPAKEYKPEEDSRVEIFALGEYAKSPYVSWR